MGILTLLDDVCNFPKGDDPTFLMKLGQEVGSHPHFSTTSSGSHFVVKHYAGDVTYDVDGFVDKNKDSLFNDLINLAQSSGGGFVRSLFPEDASLSNKKRPTTAGFKIKVCLTVIIIIIYLSIN